MDYLEQFMELDVTPEPEVRSTSISEDLRDPREEVLYMYIYIFFYLIHIYVYEYI
jgi:hypothetical protein